MGIPEYEPHEGPEEERIQEGGADDVDVFAFLEDQNKDEATVVDDAVPQVHGDVFLLLPEDGVIVEDPPPVEDLSDLESDPAYRKYFRYSKKGSSDGNDTKK